MWRRTGRSSVLLGLVSVVAIVASSCTVFLDYQYFRAIDAQEEAWYSNGDEPILAFVSFRSTPGVPGSTVVTNERRLDEVGDHVDDGDYLLIGEHIGLFTFDEIEVVSAAGLVGGQTPELIGQVVVAIENDNTPSSYINDILDDVRDELARQLANIVEPLDLSAVLADPAALAAEFAAASAAIEAAAEPSFWEKVEIALASLFDPDDFIDFNFVFFVPVTPDLAPIVDNAFTGLPPGVAGGAFPTAFVNGEIPPRELTLSFIGDHAHYDVTLFVGPGDVGYVPPTPTTTPPWDPCNPIGPPPPPPRPVCP